MMPLQVQGFALLMLCANTYKKNELHFKNLEQPGITLIAFSNRASKSVETRFTKSLWGDDRLDFSYTGKDDYITMDIEPAVNPGKHIIGNAETHVLTEKNIRTIYLERPWTFNYLKPDATQENFTQENFIAKCIKNLLPGLRSGGEIVVEWHSFFLQSLYYDPLNTHNLNNSLEMKDRQKNPFTGFFEINITRPATFYAIKKQFPQSQYPHCFLAQAKKLSEHVDSLLNFFSMHQMVSRTEINKRLLLELEILDQMKSPSSIAFIPKHPAKDIVQFNNAVDHILLPLYKQGHITSVSVVPLFVEKLKKEPNILECCKVSKLDFLAASLFYFLWSDMTVFTNGALAIKCLQDLELQDVKLWRGTSPINGRKNVWLLRGFKK